MSEPRPLPVVFFRTEAGNEPVREWLKSLPASERLVIGEDLKTLQFRWPLGMPLVRGLGGGLWELRSNLPSALPDVFFTCRMAGLLCSMDLSRKHKNTT